MQHAVVAADVDDGLAVLDGVHVVLKRLVAVDQVIVVRRLGNAHRGRVDDVAQLPDRTVVDGAGAGDGRRRSGRPNPCREYS